MGEHYLTSTLRSKLIVYLRRVLRLVYSIRLIFLPDLRILLRKFATSESAAIDTGDALALYGHVIKRKPKAILELGPGTSTAVIALAISKSKLSSRFIAIEEDSSWMTYHRKTIGELALSTVELIHRDIAPKELGGVTAAYYLDIPRVPYEFVHVDGPSNPKVGAAVSCDIIDLLPDLSPKCVIVFDGREASARFALPYLERAGFRTRRNPFTLSYEFVRG